jgi:glycerophosphoryl diester phosphodiesterase
VLPIEVNNLKYAFQRTKMPITQLTDDTFAKLPDKSYPNYGALLADMSNIARYAKGLGPYKATLLTNYDTNTGDIRAGPAGDSGIVTRAHTAGLQVSSGAWEGTHNCMQATTSVWTTAAPHL